MKKVAVITDAISPEFFFPVWHRYYGGLFGTENLHVVTYKDMRQAFAGMALGNLWAVNAAYDDTLRIGVIADLIAVLLRSHDVVIRCDVDEFLYPDPARFTDLADFINRNELPYVTAHGIDVIELAEDAPLDLGQPIFAVQRHYGMRAAALNKTCVTTLPLRWAEGFHGASVPPHFAGLYNLHLKFADLKKRIAWDQTMLQGLVPGSKAHQYFSAGAQHLTDVRNFLAGLPKTGTETQAAFDARFLATLRHNQSNGIHQGQFLTQDFLIPLSTLGITAPVPAPPETLRRFDALALTDQPADFAILGCLEAPQTLPRPPPDLIADFSDQGLTFAPPAQLHIHGSYLVRQEDALLFGPNLLVSPGGQWSCETRINRAPFLEFCQSAAYGTAFPGAKPRLAQGPAGPVLDLSMLAADDVRLIDEPVFLATPSGPASGARWTATMPAKIARFRQHGAGRKFLCHAGHEWQRACLRLLGVPDDDILPHDPGRAYICRDVMTVSCSLANMTISAAERANYYEIVALRQARGTYPAKLLVARSGQPGTALTAALGAMGFTAVTPEALPFNVQIGLFAAAEQIIFLTGSAVANAVFCPPGTSVVTVESALAGANMHTALFTSLGLRHGVIFSAPDGNAAAAAPVIETFFRDA